MVSVKSAEYASSSDFCRIFDQQMDSLYLLSFLLTADREKAEQCFVSGLEDSVSGNRVFKEWAPAWARRMIIKNALRVMDPQPAGPDRPTIQPIDRNDKSPQPERSEIPAILALPSFERFVYVMSVLERYSDQDCSLLLGCRRRDVMAGRVRALARFARFAEARGIPAGSGRRRMVPSLLGVGA
jgi:hypothetical protein